MTSSETNSILSKILKLKEEKSEIIRKQDYVGAATLRTIERGYEQIIKEEFPEFIINNRIDYVALRRHIRRKQIVEILKDEE